MSPFTYFGIGMVMATCYVSVTIEKGNRNGQHMPKWAYFLWLIACLVGWPIVAPFVLLLIALT